MSKTTKTFAMHVPAYGDAGQLQATEIALAPPGPLEARIRHTAIGVNFVDIYHRTGLYPLPSLPAVPGLEAAGVVEAVGAEVTHLRPGQRVAYVGPPVGAYANERNIVAARLVALPDEVSDTAVASGLLRGITAHMLFERLHPLQAGEFILVHAAAGGLGQVLGQWQRPEGTVFIGTAGSAEKAALARQRGYQHVIEYKQQDFVQATRELSAGLGVHFAVDGIGGETLARTLQAVRPFGMVANVGQASGSNSMSMADIHPGLCVSINRPSVVHYMTDSAAYHAGAQATLEHLKGGMQVEVALQLPLHQAAEAHRALEAGRTAGAVLLIP
jgi:NADPH:quinone reductase-like Zn-dependent oxidoreductase